MSQDSESTPAVGPNTDARKAARYVFEHLADLRAGFFDKAEVMAELDRAVAAILEGVDLDEALQRLHQAQQAAGDAQGLYGQLRSPSKGWWSGADPVATGLGRASRPPEPVYVCPLAKRCSRVEILPTSTTPLPRCQIGDRELAYDREV